MRLKNIEQHFYENKQFVKKLSNVCKRVSDNEFQMPFGFVDASELDIINSVCNNFPRIDFILKTLISDFSEKRLLIIYPKDYYKDLKYSSLYRVKYQKKYKKLSHRDILGAFTNNDINFTSIGGIIVSEDGEINLEILNKEIDALKSICMISNVSVNYLEIDTLDFEIESKKCVELNISSLRLDNIIKGLMNSSRKKSQKMISSKFVKVNQAICMNNNYILKVGNVVSIKGLNRFEIHEIRKKNNGRFIVKVR